VSEYRKYQRTHRRMIVFEMSLAEQCWPFSGHDIYPIRSAPARLQQSPFESYQLTPAAPVPDELLSLQRDAALLAGVEPPEFSEVLVTEYPPGAGIGWHRDAPHFGIVAGVSFAAPCRMCFRRGETAIGKSSPSNFLHVRSTCSPAAFVKTGNTPSLR
jgi:2OG-Fe(II) oxygenase superfamily